MDVGRTDLFQMDSPTAGLSIAPNLYPIPLKYQKLMDEGIRLLENAECISNSLKPVGSPSHYSIQNVKPFKPSKTTALLSFRLQVTQ